MSCVTSVDAIAVQSAGAAAMGINAVRALRERALGLSSAQRRQLRWERQAEFLVELGHDPVALLGPPPAQAEPNSRGRLAATTAG